MAQAVRLPPSSYPGRRNKADILSGVSPLEIIATSKVIARNTVEYTTDDGIRRIRYHDTNVISFLKGMGNYIHIDSGGFNTMTTRNRVNEALQKAGIRAHMFQRNNCVWFEDTAGQIVEFDNFLALDSKGKIL